MFIWSRKFNCIVKVYRPILTEEERARRMEEIKISVAGWVEYSQNATLIFISAYSAYVFCGRFLKLLCRWR